MKKRIISLVLCVLMLAGLIPTAFAADYAAYNNCLQEIMTGENCPTDFCGKFCYPDSQETYYAPISIRT